MTKEVYYRYLGTNGIIESPVHLEDIYYIRLMKLTADFGKLLTKDGKKTVFSIIVPEKEANEWYEVLDKN